jgi:uroporphyrinogen decarboxylase
MLSPEQFSEFSAIYIRHITESFKYSGISFVSHTCGNTMHLVEKMVRSGVNGVSLDSPDVGVDLAAVAKTLPEDVVVIGNVNPATTMRFGSPAEVRGQVDDLPQETPVENIRVFMEAGRGWKRR